MAEPEQVVVLAVQAAGQYDEGWETRVNILVPMVAGLLRPRSDPMKVAAEMAEADVIFGEYRGKRLEETSQRLIVTLMADNGDELEEMRTHRVDEPAGRAMELRLMGLKEGDRCAFFKHVDTLDRTRKVRTLVGIERQPMKNARPATPPQRPGGTGAGRPAESIPHASAEAPVPNQSVAQVIRGLLHELGHAEREKARQLLIDQGWESAEDIPKEELERAMYIVRFQRTDHF